MLSGVEFEHHVAELYRRLGYKVEVTRASGDQGLDVIAQSPQQRLGIQCKQWSGVVGNDGVQEAIAGRAYYNCSHAVVICTSTFTQPARDLAARGHVELIDGYAYTAMVNQFNPMGKPSGLAAWLPKGRAGTMQMMLIGAAMLVAVFLGLQGLNLTPRMGTEAAQGYGEGSDRNASEVSFSNVVREFYSHINAHEYSQAYAMLSQSFQASQPYSKWLAGYTDTISSSPQITATDDRSVVNLVLTANERFGTGTKVTVYSGALRGVQASNGMWLIDSGNFHMLSRATLAQPLRP